jgi:MutL protein
MSKQLAPQGVAGRHVALDIGSTVVKLAHLDEHGGLASQAFFPRDYQAGIASQVGAILAQAGIDPETQPMLVCSSANGGLRVGIVCLSPLFSGVVLRNQVLLAGANPEFVHSFDEARGDSRRVDVLLVGGGIDEDDAGPAAALLASFDPSRYAYDRLVYCGNRTLAPSFLQRFPDARVIDNPLGTTLSMRVGSVFDALRRAYLDDLVHKEGISQLPPALARSIRPTPEVASRGFLRSINGQGTFSIVGSCLVLDIGGATTDLHYSVECVAEDSEVRPAGGVSVARYVFTDLGIFASRDTLMLRLRNHPRLYEFLAAVLPPAATREAYASLREGELQAATAEVMSYGCLFIALDRFTRARGPGLPKGDLAKVAQVILTGGAAQALQTDVVSRLLALLSPGGATPPLVQIDRRYEIWVAGITWLDDLAR